MLGKKSNRWLLNHIEKLFNLNCITPRLASIPCSLLVCNRACGVWLPLSQSHNLLNTFSQSNPLRTPSQLHRLPYWFPLPTKCLPDPFSLNPGAIYVFFAVLFFLSSFYLLADFASPLNVFAAAAESLLACDRLCLLSLCWPALSQTWIQGCQVAQLSVRLVLLAAGFLLSQIPQGLNRPRYLLTPLFLCAMCT